MFSIQMSGAARRLVTVLALFACMTAAGAAAALVGGVLPTLYYVAENDIPAWKLQSLFEVAKGLSYDGAHYCSPATFLVARQDLYSPQDYAAMLKALAPFKATGSACNPKRRRSPRSAPRGSAAATPFRFHLRRRPIAMRAGRDFH